MYDKNETKLQRHANYKHINKNIRLIRVSLCYNLSEKIDMSLKEKNKNYNQFLSKDKNKSLHGSYSNQLFL